MQENLQGIPEDPSTGASNVNAPVSPEEAPMSDPSMMGGQPQVNPEQEAGMRFELERMLGKINDKDAAFKERQVLSAEKLEGLKAKIVKEIFSLMKDLGVDPSDLNSINEFLQKLQQQDPDLYVMFESAINSLSPEEVTGVQGAEMPSSPAMPGAGAPPMMPGAGASPEAGSLPEASALPEAGGGLMEGNTSNLQENILRQ